jgi:hypothetical protein
VDWHWVILSFFGSQIFARPLRNRLMEFQRV